jgi:RNA-directed DNA polymerase
VEGTPQGGPLSPLLSNILLDELDRELEGRGHRFVRYADDCNVYVHSRRSGERVMASLSRFLQKRLRLKVNAGKSAVDRPWRRSFLSYTVTSHYKPRLKVAESAVRRLKGNIRELCRKGRGRSLERNIEELTPKLRGWASYFRLAEVKGIFEELDQWLRRRLRCLLWRQWKRPFTRARRLMQRGLPEQRAWKCATNGRGPWWNAGAAHMHDGFRKSFFANLGLISLMDQIHRFQSAL